MNGPWPDYLKELEHPVGNGPEYWRDLRTLLAHDWARNVDLAEEDLRRITCPVLVCHGDRDRVQPVGYAEHLAAGLPDAELFVVEGAGHALQLDRPELFVEALERFLERRAPPLETPRGGFPRPRGLTIVSVRVTSRRAASRTCREPPACS